MSTSPAVYADSISGWADWENTRIITWSRKGGIEPRYIGLASSTMTSFLRHSVSLNGPDETWVSARVDHSSPYFATACSGEAQLMMRL